MIKYSKLRDKLKVETLNGNAEDLAFFTHYLHNHTNGVSKSFEKRAKEYFETVNEELSIVAEPELQAMLPIKWDIPFPAPEKPETTIKIPLSLDNKTAVQEWLDSIVDLETKAKLVHWYENRKAKDFKTLRLPMAAAESIGIPEEFRNVVNSKRIISDNLQPLYMLLESLGYYKKPTLCIYGSIVMEESEVENAAA